MTLTHRVVVKMLRDGFWNMLQLVKYTDT